MGKPKLNKTREQHIYSYTDAKGKKKYAYRYRYTRPNGKKTDAYKQGFKTAKDAALALTKVKADLLSGHYIKVDNSDMTVRQLCELYIKYKSGEWRKSTMDTNTNCLNSVIELIGDMKIQKLNKVNYRLQYVDIELGRVSARTVKHRHTIFSSAINFAVDEDILDKNRINRTKIEYETNTDAFTTEELEILFDFIEEKRPKFHDEIATLAYTGMRVGEMCGLKWKDIDFVNETISIERTYDRHGERPPKTKNSIRVIPLPAKLKEIYREKYIAYKKRVFQETATIDYKRFNEDYVFKNNRGKPITHNRFDKFFKKFREETTVEGHSHKLRHTYATILIGEGFDIATVASLLGDTIETVQKVYVHAIDTHREKASAHINDMFDARLKHIL